MGDPDSANEAELVAESPEADNSSEEEQQPPSSSPAPSHIELVRILNRTIHISPIDRKREIDYTVINNDDKEFNFLYLPLRQFVRNLQVFDEDERRLNYYPNYVVKRMLENIREEDEEGYQRFQHRFKHADYKMLIQLPPDNPLGPGELRTIRLTFEADEQVNFRGFSDPSLLRGWWGSWRQKFFNIPYFSSIGERFPGHPHDEFVIVVGAPGHASTGNREIEGGDPAQEPYTNGLDDNTRVFSLRLPPADDRRYSMKLEYELIPNHIGLMRALAIYWVVATISGLISAGISLFGGGTGSSQIGQTVSVAFLTVTIGVIFALDMDWADRYQIMCVIPLLFHGIAWILWFLSVP